MNLHWPWNEATCTFSQRKDGLWKKGSRGNHPHIFLPTCVFFSRFESDFKASRGWEPPLVCGWEAFSFFFGNTAMLRRAPERSETQMLISSNLVKKKKERKKGLWMCWGWISVIKITGGEAKMTSHASDADSGANKRRHCQAVVAPVTACSYTILVHLSQNTINLHLAWKKKTKNKEVSLMMCDWFNRCFQLREWPEKCIINHKLRPLATTPSRMKVFFFINSWSHRIREEGELGR